jgi:hypothetical protein
VRTTGDQKIRISRFNKCVSFSRENLVEKQTLDRSIDRSIEGGLFERASEEEEEKSRQTFFSRRLTLRPVVFRVLRWFL